MPKAKTHKSIAKRIKITKSGKLKKVKSGQGHFNSRESSKVTRQKRTLNDVPKTQAKNIRTLLPYS